MSAYSPRGIAFTAISQALDAGKSAAKAMLDGDDDTAAAELADAHRMITAALRNIDPNNARLNP